MTVHFEMPPAPSAESESDLHPVSITNPETLPTSGVACLKCHKNAISYECDPCGCPAFCRDCAPKLASGGRCKTCKSFYGGLRRIRDHE